LSTPTFERSGQGALPPVPGQAAAKKKGSPLRRCLVAGVLVWLPIIATLWVVTFLFHLADRTLLLFPLPYGFRPQGLMSLALPALGALFVLAVLLLTGLLGTNLIGRRLLVWGEELLQHIPIVGSVYGGVKSFAESVFSQSNSFRKVVMIEYPRKGSYTIGFLTGIPGGDVLNHLGEEHVSVYVPTTPNPTSGFFLMMPKSEVVELDMTVDAALKYIVSMGVVAPAPSAPTPVAPARRPTEPPM